ncbi:MAG: hypothetical protein ACM3H8_06500 [Sphingobacteriales bacterium]
MFKPALIIIFNHKYDRNIDKLKKIYHERFSNILFLVPFYTGNDEKVIPVYENSHQFQGYIAQGFRSFYKDDFTHYIFMGDDVYLNPNVNENNFNEFMKIGENDCFVPTLDGISAFNVHWIHRKAMLYNPAKEGVEIINELPPVSQALEKFNRQGLTIKKLNFKQVYGKLHFNKFNSLLKSVSIYLKDILFQQKNYQLRYPLAGGYSDLLIVSKKHISSFVHLCGAFAASDLFVELAIPTALVLVADNKIITEKDLQYKGLLLWTQKDMEQLMPYQTDLKKLKEQFPANRLYIHPVKLSKWKM